MKRFIFIIISTSLILSACGNSLENNNQSNSIQASISSDKQKLSEDEQTISVELPLGTDSGDGIMYISTPGGTSEEGNIPTVLVQSDTVLEQIGVNTSNFNMESFSYVYIDSVLIEKDQFGDSQSTISLEGEFLKEGEHIISVVQYDNNEEMGNITTYKEARYNIQY